MLKRFFVVAFVPAINLASAFAAAGPAADDNLPGAFASLAPDEKLVLKAALSQTVVDASRVTAAFKVGPMRVKIQYRNEVGYCSEVVGLNSGITVSFTPSEPCEWISSQTGHSP
jgi:hypothetical protein